MVLGTAGVKLQDNGRHSGGKLLKWENCNVRVYIMLDYI